MSNKRGLLLATTFEDVEVKRAEKKYLKKKFKSKPVDCLWFIYCCLISYSLFIYLLEGEVTFKAAACHWQPLGCRLHVNFGWSTDTEHPRNPVGESLPLNFSAV